MQEGQRELACTRQLPHLKKLSNLNHINIISTEKRQREREGERGRKREIEGERAYYVPDSQRYQGIFAISVGPRPWYSQGNQQPAPTALQE